MKTLLLLLVVAGAAFLAGWKFGLMQAPKPVALATQSHPSPSAKPPGPAARIVRTASGPGQGPAPVDAAGMALAEAVDRLTSPHIGFLERRTLLDRLGREGRLPEVIAAMKQLAAENSGDAAIPTALGEAELAQVRALMEGGAGPADSDVAMLALQADKDFSAALALDPTDWPAEFEKAAALSRWPPALNKGPEVIQLLTTLVAQQEASTTPQPEYAETYAILGRQYAAQGDNAKALQIWQQGLSRFPLSPTLQQAVTHAAPP